MLTYLSLLSKTVSSAAAHPASTHAAWYNTNARLHSRLEAGANTSADDR